VRHDWRAKSDCVDLLEYRSERQSNGGCPFGWSDRPSAAAAAPPPHLSVCRRSSCAVGKRIDRGVSAVGDRTGYVGSYPGHRRFCHRWSTPALQRNDRWAPRTDGVTRLDGADLVVGVTSCIRLAPRRNGYEYRGPILSKPARPVRPALATAGFRWRALGARDAIDTAGAGIRCQEWIRAG